MKSIKVNTFFNFLLTFSTILFPLVSMPYISKVLKISDIGLVNKGTAFCTLFTNLFSFGLAGYASRQVARVRDDKLELNRVFSSVLLTHILLTVFGLCIYFTYSFFFVQDDNTKTIFLLFSILFAVQPFAIEWLYSGLEEFKYISLRSIFVKLLMLASLFVFVHEEKDFVLYAILYIGAQGLNALFNIIHSRKFVRFSFKNLSFKSLLWSSKFFYLQTILAVCYQNINQLILGKNTEQLAYFVRGTTLVGLVGSFVGPVINAVKPRLENIIGNDADSYKKFSTITFEIVSFVIWPLGFGIAALSENIMFLFGGEAFKSGYRVLMILAIGSIFTQYSVFFNTIISTPAGFEKNTFWGNLVVAMSALILNPICIAKYGAIGAAFVLAFSELLGMIVQLCFIKKQKLYLDFLNFKQLVYFISAFVMFALIRIFKHMCNFNIMLEIVLYFFVGALSYIVLILINSVILKDTEKFGHIRTLLRR